MSVEVNDTSEVDEGRRGDPDLLDSEQIADIFGVNVKLVRRWHATGQLRSVRIGQRRITRRAWLDEFIDQRADEPLEP